MSTRTAQLSVAATTIRLNVSFPLFISAQKMKFVIKNLFSKCDQIRSFSLMENFLFYAVYVVVSRP